MAKGSSPKENDSKKNNTILVVTVIVMALFIFIGLVTLITLGIINIVQQEDITALNSRIDYFEDENERLTAITAEYSGAYKAPYVVMRGRTAEAVFKKIDGELITWTWPADSFEESLSEGLFKRKVVPEVFVPMISEVCTETNSKAYAVYSAYYDFCSYSCSYYGDCSCRLAVSNYYDDYLEGVQDCKDGVAKMESYGMQYKTLSYSGGGTARVVDVTEFVEPDLFTDVIDTLYDPSKSDRENILEIWNVNSQLTTYSEEFEETPRYSLETLSEGGGDCEDKAILVASLLKAVPEDWKVQLVYMDADNQSNPVEVNHVLVYVSTGTYSTYIEATAEQNGLDAWEGSIIGWYYDV